MFKYWAEGKWSGQWSINFSKSTNTKAWLQINDFSQIASPFKAYFSISTHGAAERPKLDRALAERQLSSRLREQTLHFYPYLRANILTDRQANTCAQTQFKRWEAELSLTPTGPDAREFFFQGLSSTPSFALQLILVASASVCLAAVCVGVCAY